MVPRAERPAGQDQVAVAPLLARDVQLIRVVLRPQLIGQQPRLVIVAGAEDVSVTFLKTYNVGALVLDDLDDPFEPVAAVVAYALVDVVAEQAHKTFCR